MAHAAAHHVKDKLKHLVCHSDTKETTPDAAPGYANLDGLPTDTTNNIPEAYYPGSKPVVPNERHSTNPYTSALGVRN